MGRIFTLHRHIGLIAFLKARMPVEPSLKRKGSVS